MYCKCEELNNGNVLVTDEISRFLGEIPIEMFIDSIDGDKEGFTQDEDFYFYVDKEKLNFCFQSFSAEKSIK